VTDPTAPEPRHWTLPLPFHTPPLTLNQRLHHMKKWRKEQEVQAAALVLARKYKVTPCDRISVELHWRPKTRRARDGDNLFATVKPLVDGLRQAGVVTDDDSTRVEHRNPVIHPAEPGQRHDVLWLVITDLSDQHERN
jgi:crossover junction endodeoxyribonuclease RusA